MTWSDFYLICFAVGFCFSFFSFVFGSSRFGKLHLPHFHGHSFGHVGAPTAHASTANGQAATHGPAAAHGSVHSHGVYLSPFNPPSIAAFLAWFGGTGYLLTRFSALWVGTDLSASVAAGLAGG